MDMLMRIKEQNSHLFVDHRMSTPQPIKDRPGQRSPLIPKKVEPRSRWSILARMKRCKSEPNVAASHNKKRCEFLNATSAHAGDLALQSLEINDDDDTASEETTSIGAVSESSSRASVNKHRLDCVFDEDTPTFAEALWDHVTLDPEELAFRVGEVIQVTDMGDRDWWYGVVPDSPTREGWFPAAFVRLHANQTDTAEDFVLKYKDGHMDPDTALKRYSTTLLSKDQARTNVVMEIIHAEREYVKHLRDVIEGYVEKARKRPEMFTEDRLKVIFSNIADIYAFSSRLLEDLEKSIEPNAPHLSHIGGCFLKHQKRFEIYSQYCNNHPSAVEELRTLQKNKKYQHFFEACRLLQQMIEIPLQGFLLTPVQKICKYPLQLKELLKYTRQEHGDYRQLQEALEGMKHIAMLINERKRKLESIEKIAQWQGKVEDWEGPDLTELSSELIHCGEMYKVNSSGWHQERVFFLFDHQLVYCKKDLLWRDVLIYRGRIDLDQCEIHSMKDGRDPVFNIAVKHGIKILDQNRDKWFLVYCKSPEHKEAWMSAFQKERHRVMQDRANGFDLAEYRHNVKQNCLKFKTNNKKGKKKRLSNKDLSYDIPDLQTHNAAKPAHLTVISSPLRKLSTKEALQYAQSQNKKSGLIPFLKRKIKK